MNLTEDWDDLDCTHETPRLHDCPRCRSNALDNR